MKSPYHCEFIDRGKWISVATSNLCREQTCYFVTGSSQVGEQALGLEMCHGSKVESCHTSSASRLQQSRT